MQKKHNISDKGASGIALPPKHLQEKLPEAWLKSLKVWGYFALALQNDPTLPRKGAERNPREGIYRLHFLHDLGAEKPRQESLAYFREASRKAKLHGLKVLLDCWEPSVPLTVWRKLPERWKAVSKGKTSPMHLDMSCPEAAEWYWLLVERAFSRLPDVDGVILGREDNEALLLPPGDPHCAAPSEAGRWAAFYQKFQQVLRGVRPDLEMILYDWWWKEGDHAVILDALPGPVGIVSRFENNTKPFSHPTFFRNESLLNDVTLSADTLINEAPQIMACYRARGNPVYVMVPFMGPLECFMVPYALAPEMYLRKIHRISSDKFAGWMDYDCGGIDSGLTSDLLEVYRENPDREGSVQVETLVARRYGQPSANDLRKAFGHFEKAIRLLPLDVFARSNRMVHAFGYVLTICMGLPIRPSDAWQARQDWERPDGRYGLDPHNYFDPRSLERILSRLPFVVSEQQSGLELFRRQAAPGGTAAQAKARAYDAGLAEAYCRMLTSAHHFFSMGAVLQKIRRDNRIIPADLATLEYLREEEIENTRAFAALIAEHSEFYANSTHDIWRYIEACDSRVGLGPSALTKKCAILNAIDWQAEIRALSPTVATGE
jgi:hypothetical protein